METVVAAATATATTTTIVMAVALSAPHGIEMNVVMGVMVTLVRQGGRVEGEGLFGVWRLAQYSRSGQPLDWEGIMVITPGYFARNYMAIERPKIQDDYHAPVDLTDHEKTDMVEALHEKYGGASGTYRVEKDMLFFNPIVSATPGLADRNPSRRFELNREGTELVLRGSMSRGPVVEEIWERVEDFV